MPRRKTKPESPRERLVRLLQAADVRSPDTLASWLSKQLSEHALVDEWVTFKNERVPFDPIAGVRGPKFQDYFIVLMHQHDWFKSKCQRLQNEIDRDRDEEYEGAYGLTVRRLMTSDEGEVTRLDAQIQHRQTEFRQEKQRQAREEKLIRLKREMKLLRSRKPAKPLSVNWCQPMPVTSVPEPLGYCQATAQHERKVLDLLREEKLLTKQAEPLKRPGRGAPLKRYPVATNLRVLDVWLGEWLPQEPNRIADTIFDALCWQAHEEEGATEDVDRFLKVLLKHWGLVKGKITDPDLVADSASYQEVMTDPAAWRAFLVRTKTTQRHVENLRDIAKQTGKTVEEWIAIAQRLAENTPPPPPTRIV